jgi:hypothetical protein
MAGGKSKVFAVTPNESSRKGAKNAKDYFHCAARLWIAKLPEPVFE